MEWEILERFLSPLAALFIGWVLSSRKRKKDIEAAATEIETKELNNIDKALEIWRKLSGDLERQLKEAFEEIRELREKVRECEHHRAKEISIKDAED